MSFTITVDCTLPSMGLVYDKKVNPNLKIRSMTTEEEMRRLAHTERPYKLLCDIIEECIVGEKPSISVYDMCLGDYQYLLQRLRVATYGNEYKIIGYCPHCGAENHEVLDLDMMDIRYMEDELKELLTIQLPMTGKFIGLRLQTPRSMDDNAIKRKQLLKDNPNMESDPTIMYTLQSLIATIDGETPTQLKLNSVVRQLPMRDSNKILNRARKLNENIGYNMLLSLKCKQCGLDYNSNFRITSEFFGPTED